MDEGVKLRRPRQYRKCQNPRCGVRLRAGELRICPACRYIGRRKFANGMSLGGVLMGAGIVVAKLAGLL